MFSTSLSRCKQKYHIASWITISPTISGDPRLKKHTPVLGGHRCYKPVLWFGLNTSSVFFGGIREYYCLLLVNIGFPTQILVDGDVYQDTLPHLLREERFHGWSNGYQWCFFCLWCIELIWVKSHKPGLLPVLEVVQVILKLLNISVWSYTSVQQSVISKEANARWNSLR